MENSYHSALQMLKIDIGGPRYKRGPIRDTIGPGLDEIDGDQKTEVKVQVQIKL